ncbi:MAG: LysR family transcriptional regulator [Burkholderiales bacterium]|nr:LysR family transcriptional regulator [Burkholderiales bacterium]OJX08981.1 MAG: LysR family transcriptional regulator [Burkholderiales bacterium 70-64]
MNFRTLDLNLLRVFDEIMAERNITRAAANLAMTQPAVSNALKRLREALGDELVVRSGYGVEPTPTALSLWPSVREALARLRAAFTPSSFVPAEAQVTFNLAMADATASLLIPPLVAIIEREAPGVTLRVLPLTTRDPRHLLATQDIDIAVGHLPNAISAVSIEEMDPDATPEFGHRRLYSSHYACVMRRDHPLAAQELTLDAYCAAHHLLVSVSGRPYGNIDETLAAMGRSRRIVLTVNQFFTAGIVVANSDLLTVLPRHFLASTGTTNKVAVRPLPMELPRVDVEALWLRRRASRPGHEWLRASIARAAAAPLRERTPGASPPPLPSEPDALEGTLA